MLPSGCATLSVEKLDGGDISATIAPLRSGAAEITIIGDDEPQFPKYFSLSFGRGITYEGPWDIEHSKDIEQDVRELCQAVVAGNYVETVWLKNGVEVAELAEVKTKDRVARSYWSHTFALPISDFFRVLFRKSEKKEIHYGPYFDSCKQNVEERACHSAI
ncbi:MAG: hypothetical protein JSV08_05585 [Acidobacteriota bacterium]|nr:MAG: hypothetical protein JSV08_05585 [Acidobacteriota bacterium]